MEERILHSADLAPLLVSDAASGVALQQPLQTTTNASQTGLREIVFVDQSVPDADALLADLQSQRSQGRALEIVSISADQDGVAVITDTLRSRQGLSAVHVLAHGSEGLLQLGNVHLDAQRLLARAEEVAGWGTALTDDGDLMLYGCDFAQTGIGQQMVRDLAGLTGADVAASSDATGAAARGGNWVLEQRSGSIETASVASAALQHAWAGLLGNDFQVNSTTGNTQSTDARSRGSQQAVAYDASGNFVVVWTSDKQDGDKEGVYARRFNAQGNALTNEIRVAQSYEEEQRYARVASDSAGNFVVTWTSNDDDDEDRDDNVYMRRFSAAGNALTAQIRVNTFGGGSQSNSVIGMHASTGDFVIAWQGSGTGDSAGVYFRRFAANGTGIDPTDRHGNVTDNGSEQNAAVAMDSTGRFVVAFDVGGNTFFQRFSAAGIALGGRTQVDTAAASSFGAAIAMDGTGNFTVVYQQTSGPATGVWARGFNANGADLYGAFQASTGNASSPSIAMSGGGAFMVAYHASGSDAQDVFVRRYSANGAAIGSAVPINQYTSGDQKNASVALSSASNDFVVVWSGKSALDSKGVNGRIFTIALAPVITSNGGGASASISVPENTLTVTTVSATDANGDALVYSIAGGADQNRFAIDAVTGVLTFGQAPDFENPADSDGDNLYEVHVRASDGTLTDNQTLSVTVTNVVSELKVTTAADTVDGDVSSIGALINNKGADGRISLREAILAANATAGTDSVVFDIAGPGPHVILLSSLLPQITDSIQLLGLSEPDVAANAGLPVVVIDGNDLAGDGLVLRSGAAGSTISGFVIRNFNGDGIWLQAGADGAVITGNLIGRFNTTGGDGGAGLSNTDAGIHVESGGNTIGGNSSSARNVISGNSVGILIDGGSARDNWVAGNRIGTNAAGTVAIGNAAQGIVLRQGASNNTIGSDLDGQFDALEGNQIVSAGQSGIRLWDSSTSGNLIRGNLLGTNAAGTNLLGQNLRHGIEIGGGASNNTVGGTSELSGNTVVGSKFAGVQLTGNATGNTLQGNFIGTDAAGGLAGGNGTFGIYLDAGAFDNSIGGDEEGAGNRVTNNTQDGVAVVGITTVGNAILANQIDANGGLGISLDGGMRANDALDVDDGANDLQNHPVLDWADVQSGNTVISGKLLAKAGTVYRLEFFSAPVGDSSGYGEGSTLLGAMTVTTDAAGNASVLVTFNGVEVTAGHVVSATATVDLGGGIYRSTSAFGPTVKATVDNATPVISSNGGAETAVISIPENTTAVTTVTAAGSNGNPIHYSISGGDASRFTINASTGVLAFVSPPDYENPTDIGPDNVYDIIVMARSGGLFDTQSIAITVTDLGGPLTVTTDLDTVDGDVSSIEALLANKGADGRISLREAISAANNTPGADTIVLPSGHYLLTPGGSDDDMNLLGDLDVTADLIISGGGSATTTISGGVAHRVFDIRNGTLTLSGVSIRDGSAGEGAGIRVNGGASLQLSQSVLRDNKAADAGGALQGGAGSTITLSKVEIRDNKADVGAGMHILGGSLTATDTTLDGNTAIRSGGGLYHAGGTATLTSVTISNNLAGGSGAGLYFIGTGAAIDLSNSTVSGNTADGVGGGLYADRAITVRASTIAYNSASAGAGIYLDAQGSASVGSSIVAANAGGNSNSAVASAGYNLDSGADLGLNQSTDRSNTDPLLAALADNGGFTRTHALLDGSAALDAGDPLAPPADQRGVARVLQADIGAYEADAGTNRPPVNTLPSSISTTEDTVVILNGLSVHDANEAGAIATTKILFTRLSVSNGILGITLSGGATVSAGAIGSETFTLSGSQAAINATLATLTYLGNANFFGNDNLVMFSQDGAGLSDSDAMAIAVLAVNDAPSISAPASIDVTEDLPSAVTGIVFSDVDAGVDDVTVTFSAASGALSAVAVPGIAVGGSSTVRTLSGSIADINAFVSAGGLTFLGTSHGTDAVTLAITINDNGIGGVGTLSANTTTTLFVKPVNDAPTVGAPASFAATEDTPLLLTGVTFADVDAAGGTVIATFSVGSGVLAATSQGGVAVGGTPTALSLSGSLSDINSFIAAGFLSFTPERDMAGTVTLTSTIDDGGNTGVGGPLSASAVSTIVVAAVNDAPTVNAPTSFAVVEDTPLALTGISFADVDAAGSPVTATFSIGSGVLAAISLNGVSVAGTSVALTLQGSISDINSFIAAGHLSFTPVLDMAGTVTLTSTINDAGNTGAGTALSASAWSTLTIAAVNDAPTLIVPTSFAVIEDTPLALTGISFADVDAPGAPVTATFGVGSGELNATGSGGVSVSGTATAMSLSGTVNDINNFIAAGHLGFIPTWNMSGAVTLTTTIHDGGNSGLGGPLSASAVSTLTISAVNDAPTIAAPTSIGVTEDVASPVIGIVFADVDAGSNPVTVTFNVATGALAAATGGGVVVSGSADSLVLHGSTIDINSFLAAGGLTFTTAADDTAALTLNVTIEDGGSTGAGGTLTATAAINLSVTAVNDAPSIATPATMTVAEDIASAITGIIFSDVDAGSSAVLVTLSVSRGVLLATSQAGVVVTGTGSATVTLDGTIGDINVFIADAGLWFVPINDDLSDVVMVITINDQGHSGTGAPMQANAQTTLRITSANDAPTVAAPALFALTEDTPLALTGIIFADVDAGNAAVTATFSVGSGSLTATLGGMVAVAGTPTALTLDGTLSDINSFIAAGNLVYTPVTDFSGSVVLTTTINDNGSTGIGGSLSASTVSTLAVTAVNDAPTVSAPASLTVTEDVAIALSGIRFWDVDAAADLVTATFTVDSGTLSASSGAGVLVGGHSSLLTMTGTLSNINDFIASGLLQFTGAPDASGTATLTSNINDNYNGDPGNGRALSATAATTLAITPVNDAPTISAPASIGVTEDVASPLVGIVLGDVDASNSPVTVTFTTAAGTLSAVSSQAVAVSGTANALVLTGSLGTINDFLAEGSLRFTTALNDTSTVTVHVTVDDGGHAGAGGSLTATTTALLTVTAVNDAPTLAAPIAHQTALQDQPFLLTIQANTFVDADPGDTLVYAAQQVGGAALPAWLRFDAASGTFSGTPANADVGAVAVRVTATDSGLQRAFADFQLAVRNVNDAPTVGTPVGDQHVTARQTARFQLPAATFNDPDAGDSLQYAATLVDGTAFPSWLTFDPASRVFSGVPSAADLGTTTVRVVATDSAGASAQLVFNFVVIAAPDAPSDEIQTLSLPAAAEKPKAVEPDSEAEPAPVVEMTKSATPAAALRAASDSEVVIPDDIKVVGLEASATLAGRRGPLRFDEVSTTAAAAPPPMLAAALLSQIGDITLSSSSQGFLQSDDMMRKLEEMRRQMAAEGSQHQLQVASAIALSSGLSIGYVIWLIRGGVLVSSMLSAMPAWQMLDPLPVIASSGKKPRKGGDGPAEDREVERLFDDKPSIARATPAVPAAEPAGGAASVAAQETTA